MSVFIPKVFHQVWINEKNPDLPPVFENYRNTWLKLHPGWDYKLWNLSNLDFKLMSGDLVNRSANYAQMADILRYEILYQYGGVYIDTDFECFKNIDELLVGVKNFACSEDGFFLTNAFIGAQKNSIYMKRIINNLPKELGVRPTNEETGPHLYTRSMLLDGFSSDFSVFPKKYFYPYNFDETHLEKCIFSDAYAIHRWANSWGEKTFKNKFSCFLRKIIKYR